MPLAGYRGNTSNISYQGEYGLYWSSSPRGSNLPYNARHLSLKSSNVYTDSSYRTFAFPVRCFADEYVEPDSTWTVETGTLWSAGIFYNATLWLISVTNGTDKSITMKDKNEWATVVYNNWDTLSESNCGKYFQRWNYYGFPFTWTVTTSSTAISTTWYGNDNPYSSSTFITWDDRSSPSNDNLRANSKEEYFVIE